MNKILFLCTGNYYRSRFAELYFRHLAAQRHLGWAADSRGLRLSANNVGPLSVHTREECTRLGISCNPIRDPIALDLVDLEAAALVVAVKETEHRPLLRRNFPEWEERVEYWQIHDIDCAEPSMALPILREHVDQLIERITNSQAMT